VKRPFEQQWVYHVLRSGAGLDPVTAKDVIAWIDYLEHRHEINQRLNAPLNEAAKRSEWLKTEFAPPSAEEEF
jgi:hypothetical protein